MTAEGLGIVAGIVISLLFAYVPGLDIWYAKLPGTQKRLIMLGALLISALGAIGLGCIGWDGVSVTCDQAGAKGMVEAFVLAVIANQSTYLIAPPSNRTRNAKIARAFSARG